MYDFSLASKYLFGCKWDPRATYLDSVLHRIDISVNSFSITQHLLAKLILSKTPIKLVEVRLSDICGLIEVVLICIQPSFA